MKSQIVSPFQGQQGQDLYENSAVLYYFLQVVMWLYIVGAIAYLVLIANVNIRHTYQLPNTMPGQLYSDRYSSMTWIFLMLSVIGNLSVAFLVPMLVLWRKDRGCSILWMVFFVIFTLFSGFTVTVLGAQYGSCNKQNQNGNICNDYDWCCAVEIYSNPANLCPNTGPCLLAGQPSSVAELSSNVDFRWLFAVSIVFMLFDLLFFILITTLWFGNSSKIKFPTTTQLEEVVDYQEDGEEEEEEMIPMKDIENTGLRMRVGNSSTSGEQLQQGITHSVANKNKARKPHKNAGKPGVVVNFASAGNKKAQ